LGLVTDRAGLYRAARFAAMVGLGVNALLEIAKFAAGWWAGSFALIVDAVNSGGDALSSLVVALALWYA
jgi:divalent metal cation (Fe/Co/Zn/Cd) transporter